MKIKKFQAGGAIPTEDPTMAAPVDGAAAPAAGGGEDPLVMIAQMMMQALETQDCQAAMAACDAFLQFIDQMGGQGAEQAPPAEPVFKKGGKISKKA